MLARPNVNIAVASERDADVSNRMRCELNHALRLGWTFEHALQLSRRAIPHVHFVRGATAHTVNVLAVPWIRRRAPLQSAGGRALVLHHPRQHVFAVARGFVDVETTYFLPIRHREQVFAISTQF